MALLVAWLLFPLVMGTLSLGCGLLLERAAGRTIPGPLLLPSGLAFVSTVAGLATLRDETAEAAAAVVVAAAVLGLASSIAHRRRIDWWAAGCAVVAFLAFGAPVLASGEATFAGYVTLDDTSTFLALVDRAMEHGRSLEGLAPSTYEATLSVNLAHGYPMGALLPLGVGSRLVATDPAWTFQPYVAFLGALLALCLYHVAGKLTPSRPVRATVAFIAAQPALLYAFALWGGVKEVFAAAVLALTVSAVVWAHGRGWRAAIVPGAAAAALLGGLSLGGAVWLVPLAVAAAVVAARRGHPLPAIAGVATTAILGLPALIESGQFLRGGNRDSFRQAEELGNLVRPLKELQVLGVWPAGDFRFDPSEQWATYVLLSVVVAAAALGLVLAVRRRLGDLIGYAACCALGATAIVLLGSPWLDAKALAVASPACVLLALAGAAALLTGRRQVEGMLLLAAVAGGVLWSNALAYRDVSLAPRSQLGELETIGKRFAGQGPALMTEYQPYGVRHFLRDLDPEGASELRRRPVPLRDGTLLGKGEYRDLDDFSLDALFVYRTLVLRRSPAASRPPAPYRSAWSARYYEVWQQRPDAVPRVLEHLPLGDGQRTDGVPPCADVLRLAALARGQGGRLVAATPRTTLISVDIPSAMVEHEVATPASGRYGLWVGGSFRRTVEVAVDHMSATASPRIDHAGQYTPVAELDLDAGTHRLRFRLLSEAWRPGTRSAQLPSGPIVLAAAAPTSTASVAPERARSLCGRRLDWIAAVAG